MEIKSTCELCGSTYIKRNGKAKYCSDKCKKEATRRRQEKWRQEHSDYAANWHQEHPGYGRAWRQNNPNYERDRARRIRGTTVEKKHCVICGKAFETPLPHKITCSDKCKREYRRLKEQKRSRNISPEANHRAYIQRKYGSEEKRLEHLKAIEQARAAEREAKRQKAEKEREARTRVGNCVVCGAEYKTLNPAQKTCSSECGKKLANARGHKRIPKKQRVDNDITLEALYRRDSGVCYLCGKRCDWADKEGAIVGPNYPSIDHVVPVSRGGLHAWNNVRLAHFSCNVYKSDSMIEEAERLIPENAYEFKRQVSPRKKAVKQYTKNGQYVRRFPSTAEAERQTGIRCRGIQNCARGEVKSYKGYVWRYEA